MIAIRTKDAAEAKEKSIAAEREVQTRKKRREEERMLAYQRQQSLSVDSTDAHVETAIDSLQRQIHDLDSEIARLEGELSKTLESGNDELALLRSELQENVAFEDDARIELQTCQRKLDAAVMELKTSEKQLSNLQSEWNLSTDAHDALSAFASPGICRTCGQSIASSHVHDHVRKSVKDKLTDATSHVEEALQNVAMARTAHDDAQDCFHAIGLKVKSCMERLRQAEKSRSIHADGLRGRIREARSIHARHAAEFARLTRKAKDISDYNLAKSRIQAELDRMNDAVSASVAFYENCCSEVERIEKNIADLTREKDEATKKASFTSLLVDTFGPKGVQAYVLRNVVQALEYYSQAYLDELSDGQLRLQLKVGSNDSIIKQSAVRNPDGTWRDRPLSSLSGGQWRRCSLSLSLGFVDLASNRGKLRSSLLVLDEPLTHLDSAGRVSVGKLLRKMQSRDSGIGPGRHGNGLGLSTILVILQDIAADEIEECFDQIDEVVKSGGESFVILDENREV